jgi:hypothetical protein
LLVALLAPTVSRPAHAQAEDQAAARALFEDGRKLLKGGHYAEACEKLEGASKLYTSAGILLNLGDCYAKSGRTASAWTEFGEAAAVAKRTGRTSEANEATRRQAEIAPRLTRLTIHVGHPVSGLVVTRDGTAVPEAAWGAAIPVDPGSHDVSASANGYETWTGSVVASGESKTATIDVPDLQKAPEAEAAAGPESAPRAASLPQSTAPVDTHPRGPSRVVEWSLIGGGAAIGIAGGVLMAVEANSAAKARNNHDPAGYDATATPWTIGLGGVIAGGAIAVAGVVMFATRHGSESTTGGIRVAPVVGGGTTGMQVGGAF